MVKPQSTNTFAPAPTSGTMVKSTSYCTYAPEPASGTMVKPKAFIAYALGATSGTMVKPICSRTHKGGNGKRMRILCFQVFKHEYNF